MDSTERQFVRLTQLVLDGVATDAERADLAQLSAAHPELVAAVADELMVDALLKWQSGCITEELRFLDGIVASNDSSPLRTSRKTIPVWVWMIAASVLVATGVAAWKHVETNRNRVDPVIADIVHQQGVIWSDDSSALAADNTVSRGRLSSTSGKYTLQFRNGSTVRVEGRASLDIKSKMLMQLEHGQATANVPHNCTGFTITSALVNVVDQGTEFGISVEDGRADVVVFDGKVDVKSNLGQSDTPKRLTHGQAIQVDRQGAIDRLADIRRDVDGRWWGGDFPNAYKCVIAKVTDNIGGSSEVYACYQTTYRGLQDDALAYSDNPNHQWNGLTADGLPEFLRGADYIRTFNDYRYMEYFEMKVELARPANLYVFFDDRVEPPDWLKADFEDTGVDIGLDEGPWLTQVAEVNRKWDTNTTAVGSGNSIDNVFSVWRRRCVDGGTVSLRHSGEWGNDRIGFGGKGGRAMYGIAATPLDAEGVPDEVFNSLDRT